MAKNVDGVYDSDPRKNPDAKKFDTVSVEEVIVRRLDAIDRTAAVICSDNKMPFTVFALEGENSIKNAFDGIFNGTVVTV